MDIVYSLEEIQRRAAPLIAKYRIPALYLFGSYARGEATEDSDLDFLVDTTRHGAHVPAAAGGTVL